MNVIHICSFRGTRIQEPSGHSTIATSSHAGRCAICGTDIPRLTSCNVVMHPKFREGGHEITAKTCLKCKPTPKMLAPRADPKPDRCEGEGARGGRCTGKATVGVLFAWGCAGFCPKCADEECGPVDVEGGAP